MLSVGNMWAMLSRHSHVESNLAGFSDFGVCVCGGARPRFVCSEIQFSSFSCSALYHGGVVPAGCVSQGPCQLTSTASHRKVEGRRKEADLSITTIVGCPSGQSIQKAKRSSKRKGFTGKVKFNLGPEIWMSFRVEGKKFPGRGFHVHKVTKLVFGLLQVPKWPV